MMEIIGLTLSVFCVLILLHVKHTSTTDATVVPCGPCKCIISDKGMNLIDWCPLVLRKQKTQNGQLISSIPDCDASNGNPDPLVAEYDYLISADKIYDCKIQGTGAYGFSGSFKFDFPTTSTTFDVAIQILDTPQINSIQQLTTYLRTTCGVGSKCKLRSLVFSEVPSLEAEDIHDLYSDFVDIGTLEEFCISRVGSKWPFEFSFSTSKTKQPEFRTLVIRNIPSRAQFSGTVSTTSQTKQNIRIIFDELTWKANDVQVIVKKIASTGPKPKVYIEIGNNTNIIQGNTYSFGYPRIKQDTTYLSSTFINIRNPDNKEQVLPKSFLERVVTFDIVKFQNVPERIEFSALGDEIIKFQYAYFGDNDTKNMIGTVKTTEAWEDFACQDIEQLETCMMCFIQSFWMGKSSDDVQNLCTSKTSLAITPTKCLDNCATVKYYVGDKYFPLVYMGYMMCDNRSRNAVDYCSAKYSNLLPYSDDAFGSGSGSNSKDNQNPVVKQLPYENDPGRSDKNSALEKLSVQPWNYYLSVYVIIYPIGIYYK